VHNILVGNDFLNLIVKNQDIILVGDSQHRVRDPQVGVLKHHDAQLAGGEIQPAQREQLGDGVVLTVAVVVEELPRHRPVILGAVVIDIQDVAFPVGIVVHGGQLLAAGSVAQSVKKRQPVVQVAAIEARCAAVAFRDVQQQVAFKYLYPLTKQTSVRLPGLLVAEQVDWECGGRSSGGECEPQASQQQRWRKMQASSVQFCSTAGFLSIVAVQGFPLSSQNQTQDQDLKVNRGRLMVQAITHKTNWIGAFFAAAILAGSGAVIAAEDPGVEAQFEEGMDALEDQRLKSAIRAFSNILDVEPELHRAKLELALAYYRSLRYEDAQKLAQEVLDDPATPPEVRVTILAFLAQVQADAEKYGRKSDYASFIAAGIMHDSNVNVGPTNAGIRVGDVETSLAPGSTSQSDNAYVLNAGVDHLYQSGKRVELGERTGTLLWQSGGGLYWRRYHEQNDYDLLVASLNTGPALLMLRQWRASLQFKSDYLTIGGNALGWFNSINPSITWQYPNAELNWDFNYTRRFYHRDVDDGREGDYVDTGVTFGRYFRNRDIAATAGPTTTSTATGAGS